MSSPWTRQPHFRCGAMLYKYVKWSALPALCLLLLSACGGQDSKDSRPKSTAAVVGTLDSGDVLAPLPPGTNIRPPATGTTGLENTSEGLPALQPPRGVNNVQLFEKELRDPDERLDRLENAVQELRNHFDSLSPSVVRLVAIEKDIQNLIGQLEILVEEDSGQNQTQSPPQMMTAPSAAPPPLANSEPLPLRNELPPAEALASPPAAPSTLPPETMSPPVAPSEAEVFGLRVGEHPAKTRIVLDVSKKVSYGLDLDTEEKILVVELPETGWGAPETKTFGKDSPLLSSYKASPSNGGKGTLLILQLKKDARLLSESIIKAEQGNGARIVIDLGRP